MTCTTRDSLFLWLCSLAGGCMLLLAGPPALAEPFRGPYAGASLGYQDSSGVSGWAFGGFAGYNLRPAARLLLGAELGLGGSTASETRRVETPTHVTVIEDSVGLSIALAARLGLLVADRTAIYGRFGWDNVRLRQVQTRTAKPPAASPGPETFEVAAFADSATIGGGVEHFVTDRVSLRLDYDWAPAFERHQLRVGAAWNF